MAITIDACSTMALAKNRYYRRVNNIFLRGIILVSAAGQITRRLAIIVLTRSKQDRMDASLYHHHTRDDQSAI